MNPQQPNLFHDTVQQYRTRTTHDRGKPTKAAPQKAVNLRAAHNADPNLAHYGQSETAQRIEKRKIIERHEREARRFGIAADEHRARFYNDDHTVRAWDNKRTHGEYYGYRTSEKYHLEKAAKLAGDPPPPEHRDLRYPIHSIQWKPRSGMVRHRSQEEQQKQAAGFRAMKEALV